MATLADRQYTLSDFQKIKEVWEEDIFTPIREKIDFLASKVGAPTYSKTPNFKKGRRGRPKCTSENWDLIRNFKSTKIIKETEGIGKIIDDVILLLNKITKHNYAKMSKKIVNIMKKIDSGDEENLLKLGNAIFLIGSSNEFYSKIYSMLYRDLINQFPFMNKICMQNLSTFSVVFETIEYISAEENYDKFCSINKDNENRRALSCFFVNMMLINIIDISLIFDLIINLIDKQNNYFNDISKKKVIDEISENIFILIKFGKSRFVRDIKWGPIYDHINKISAATTALYPALSNKTIFKFMDIIEMI